MHKLFASLNKGGRKFQVFNLAWDPKPVAKKQRLEEREPFPAVVLDTITSRINCLPRRPIVAQLSPRRVEPFELSDLVPSDAETEVDLWLHFPDCTKQTERFVAMFSKRLDEKKNAPRTRGEHRKVEINKARTRYMLCGRGARHLSPHNHLQEASPPYPPIKINLVTLAEASTADYRTTTIMNRTIGQLGPYSELVKSAVQALPDGILAFEGFPGSGKTTVTATIAAFLCLVAGKAKSFKITVIASQHAALDAFNTKLDQRLKSSVAHLNKELRDPVRSPLVLRGSIDEYAEMVELVRIVESRFESGPDPNRPNTLCELLLQLLQAGPHHLPDCSKPELVSFANKIVFEKSPGYHRLKKFIAGDLTWDEANAKDRAEEGVPEPQARKLEGELSPQSTAKKAVQDIMKKVRPLVDILICTTAAAATGNWAECVEDADVCIVEEAAAMSCPEVFAAWRGIGQVLIVSGDSNQFGPFDLRYEAHKFQEYLSTSTLHTVKTAGYPIFQLTTQHRAIDGQFDLVYKTFYPNAKPLSPENLHPRNHPDARRVEEAFVKDCAGLLASPADLIIPMFINVPYSHTSQSGPSRQNAEQAEAVLRVVEKLISRGVDESEIMVIAAYRAEFIAIRKQIPEETSKISVLTVDVAQGQERPYVVLVFSTTKETGLGFTGDPHRLCVALSRQKAFLALVGDIGTVKTMKPSGTRFYLEKIHQYLESHGRVVDYKHINNEIRDEEEERLQAEVDAAIAKLKEYQASKAKPPAL